VLEDLRASDPVAFRELLAERWSGLGREGRVAAVSAARDGLSPADEPWLEGLAGDRDDAVATLARQLLATLPGSRFAAFLLDRAGSTFRLQGRLRPTLVVTPFEGWADVLAMVPPAAWTAHLRADAKAVVERAAASEDHAGVLIPALAAATRLHRDPAFAEALLGPASRDRLPMSAGQLLAIVAPDRQGAVARSVLDGVAPSLAATILADVPDWTDGLARAVLRYLVSIAPTSLEAWHLAGLLRVVAARIPVRFADDLETLVAASPVAASLATAIDTLRARVELHRAFAGAAPPSDLETMEATP
jgi:hypothetical protein